MQRQVTAPEGHWLGRRLLGLNKRQICSKAGREQRSGRSQPCSDPFSPLFFQRDQPSQQCLHLAGLLPTAPAKPLENGFPPALPQRKIWQRTRRLLYIAANPLGSLLCSCCIDFQKKKGEEIKKKWKKSLPGCSRAAGGGWEC